MFYEGAHNGYLQLGRICFSFAEQFFSQQQLKLYNPPRGMKFNSHNSKKCYFEIKGKDDIGYLGNWQSVLLQQLNGF